MRSKINKTKIILKRVSVSGILVLVCLLLGVLPQFSKTVKAKSKYVLSGFGKNVVSDYLVIKPKCNNKKLLVKGWAYKNKKCFQDSTGKLKNYFNKKFKIARNCKVVEVEMPKNYVYSFKKYIKKYKIHGDFAGIQVELLIKGGKVYRIYRSA